MSILVAPSILSADFSRLGEEMKAVIEAGADWIHVDVMDGHFVSNLTIGAPVVKSLRRATSVPLDVHLMVDRPERFIRDFAAAGADYLTIHVESTSDPASVLKEIRTLGVRPGVTLKPSTDVSKILPFLRFADLVLVMTVEPGYSGQSFMDNQLEKIRKIRAELDALGSEAMIEVDGGINEETCKKCYEAGARVFVAGNFIYKNNYRESVKKLKEAGA